METKSILNRILSGSLVLQIAIGIVLAVVLSQVSPGTAQKSMLFGNLFVQALKAVAPVLVLLLVASAIANRKASHTAQMRPIILMYLVGTMLAALLAVGMSTMFPTTLVLQVPDAVVNAPQGISEVLNTMLLKLVDNPVNAVLTGNFIGILVWGVALGIVLHHASDTTRQMLQDLADGITQIVRIVIRFAPLGIFGLVAGNLAEAGLSVLGGYVQILTVLIGAMIIGKSCSQSICFGCCRWSPRSTPPSKNHSTARQVLEPRVRAPRQLSS